MAGEHKSPPYQFKFSRHILQHSKTNLIWRRQGLDSECLLKCFRKRTGVATVSVSHMTTIYDIYFKMGKTEFSCLYFPLSP